MNMPRSLFFLPLLISVSGPVDAMPAFPGAEGAGANALGGRGGDVYYVTTLADDGAGSLRDAIATATGPRTILFKVSGNILLASDLRINKSYLTVAGQSAPGDGITLQRRLTSVEDCHDVVVRFIRARPGDLDCPDFQDDAFHFVRATNCIADHVSASWSIDEVLSCTHYSTNITVQWCLITESLNNSCHVKGAHGYGSLLRYGQGAVTYHHNLYADHRSRNPRLGDNLKLDFVNNVIYNWGGTAGYNGNDIGDNPGGFTNVLNYVGNYLVAGPSTSGGLNRAFSSGVTDANSFEVYQFGNLIDSDKDGSRDGIDTGWGMFSGLYAQQAVRYPLPLVATDGASVAYQRVLALAGVSSVRDAVDSRVVNDVIQETGAIIDSQDDVGGFPSLSSGVAPADGDGDGIADDWEEAMGWDPLIANNNHVNPDGYTDLEWYLTWLAGPHAACDRNGTVDVNLRQLRGGLTNLLFSVLNGTNGTVTLLADGVTARFTPTTDYSGLADFGFTVFDVITGVGFGPDPVSVLVRSNAPSLLPTVTLSHPPNGATLTPGGELSVTADVANGIGTVTNVQFYVGTSEPLTLIGEDATAPFNAAFVLPDVDGVATYIVRAVAADDLGQEAADESVFRTIPPGTVVVTTADAGGADSELTENDGADTGYGAKLSTNTRITLATGGTNRHEVIGLRFSLGTNNLARPSRLTLNMVSHRTLMPQQINVYAVKDGTVGVDNNGLTPGYTDNNWVETNTVFSTMPGLVWDGDVTTRGFTNVVSLGSKAVALDKGEVWSFGSAALSAFLRTNADSVVTFLLEQETDDIYQSRFATRETTELDGGSPTGPAGWFAPYLVIEPLPSVPVSVSTGDGAGSDVEMGEQNTPAARNEINLNTRFNGDDRNEVVGLRFDLSAYALADIDNVVLNLVNYRTNLTRVIDVYGVTQGAAGGSGAFSTETWTDLALTNWGDLPGLLTSDLDVATPSLDLANLTLLVDGFTITSRSEGTVEQVSSPALTSYVRSHGGSPLITFLLTAGNQSSGQFRFCSKEATSTETGLLTGSSGDYAPFLSFTVPPPTPILGFSPTEGGTGLTLSWSEGGFRLQSQTNELSTGLSDNWHDYPGGDTSPVTVPLGGTNIAVFYRLVR